MLLQRTYLIVIILTAVFFKYSFFNVALITNSAIIDQVSHQAIFKVGKKRRRTIIAFSKNQVPAHAEEILLAEKEENEGNERIFKKVRFPSLISFITFLKFKSETVLKNNQAMFPDYAQYVYGTIQDAALSFSVLRI